MIARHVANWSEEERRFDASFALNETTAGRLTSKFFVRPATKEEIVRETDRLECAGEKRMAEIKLKMAGHMNLPQILSGLEFQARNYRKRRDVFLKYFSIRQTMVHWFEDREVGIVGWAVEAEGKIVRAFLMKAESFPT